MKLIQHFLLAVVLVGSLAYSSCKKDDPQTCDYATALQDELSTLSTAASVYSSNPTTENCLAYKAAFNTYLNAAEGYVDCATQAGQGAQLQAEIDQARVELNALQC